MAIKVDHIDPEFEDERGGIARVLEKGRFSLRAILRITSKAGTIRSNHYHKKDSHYIYVESGEMEYSEKKAESPRAKLTTVKLGSGDLVFTGPMIIHAVKFLEDSVIYAFTSEKRGQDQYEKDTVRVSIVE